MTNLNPGARFGHLHKSFPPVTKDSKRRELKLKNYLRLISEFEE